MSDGDAGYGDQFQYHDKEDWGEVRRDQSDRWSSPSIDIPRFEVAPKARDARLRGRKRRFGVESFIMLDISER